MVYIGFSSKPTTDTIGVDNVCIHSNEGISLVARYADIWLRDNLNESLLEESVHLSRDSGLGSLSARLTRLEYPFV